MQNNGSGLGVQNGSAVTLGGVSLINNGGGAGVGFRSALFSYGSTVQGNTDTGLRANANSFLRLDGNTITGNGSDGILAQRSSTAYFVGGNIVSNNGQAGIRIRDLSLGVFNDEDVTANLGGTDVVCEPQFPATRGALTKINGGSTNCVEP